MRYCFGLYVASSDEMEIFSLQFQAFGHKLNLANEMILLKLNQYNL